MQWIYVCHAVCIIVYARMPVYVSIYVYVAHSLYAGMPSVSECVWHASLCVIVCQAQRGTGGGQSGVPGHPRIQPLSSMLELVPVLTFILLFSCPCLAHCKIPTRLNHVVLISSLEEIRFLQSCFVNSNVGGSSIVSGRECRRWRMK